jgi:hypothetical protein
MDKFSFSNLVIPKSTTLNLKVNNKILIKFSYFLTFTLIFSHFLSSSLFFFTINKVMKYYQPAKNSKQKSWPLFTLVQSRLTWWQVFRTDKSNTGTIAPKSRWVYSMYIKTRLIAFVKLTRGSLSSVPMMAICPFGELPWNLTRL